MDDPHKAAAAEWLGRFFRGTFSGDLLSELLTALDAVSVSKESLHTTDTIPDAAVEAAYCSFEAALAGTVRDRIRNALAAALPHLAPRPAAAEPIPDAWAEGDTVAMLRAVLFPGDSAPVVGFGESRLKTAARRIDERIAAGPVATKPYQSRVREWISHCFGPAIAADKVERNHRFLEEALELVQSGGCTASEAHQLVDYVFGRPVGEITQEVGGVMNTLAALCNAHAIDLDGAADAELERCWGKSEQIRAKQAAKPKHGPLPVAGPVKSTADEAQRPCWSCPPETETGPEVFRCDECPRRAWPHHRAPESKTEPEGPVFTKEMAALKFLMDHIRPSGCDWTYDKRKEFDRIYEAAFKAGHRFPVASHPPAGAPSHCVNSQNRCNTRCVYSAASPERCPHAGWGWERG